MAELTTPHTSAGEPAPCCAPPEYASCCKPSEKAACCDPRHPDECGCNARQGLHRGPSSDPIREAPTNRGPIQLRLKA